MGSGLLTRYNASAGSGKTYRLTGIYLSKLFNSRSSYKKILAVTFTNKAASEMKRKILTQLYSLSEGKNKELAGMLSKMSGKTEEEIMAAANPILNNILHDYSFFNVGTIDSFFQRVLKSFTREIGLQHGYIIELDHSLILKQAVDATFAATTEDKALREWITEYSHERAEGGKSWNLGEEILKLAEEIFREKFRLIPQHEREKLKDRTFLVKYAGDLKALQTSFKERLKNYCRRCRELLEKHQVEERMFLRGAKGGVPSFLKMIEDGGKGAWKPPTNTVLQVLDNPPVWSSKDGHSSQLKNALNDGFETLFIETVRYYNDTFRSANTALFISDNIYILGILSNILEQAHIITSSENRFLLSDAGELLWMIIKDDQTPFIYEKAGNTFENFMIDEFQDTSHIQWNNFRPLIENSIAEGNDNLVVGDVKQSIYRWRNSDWKILSHLLRDQIRETALREEYLDTNWRSSHNIISFNNSLFSLLPGLIDRSDKNNTGSMTLEDLYSDAVQKYPGKRDGGMVKIEFINDEEVLFQDAVLAKLPLLIEELHDMGYSGSDIGILVRTNREGAMVLNTILEYREVAHENKRKRYNYNIISSESLLLSASPCVGFIIALLRGLYEEDPGLSRSVMIRNWMMLSGEDPFSPDLTDVEGEADRLFPKGFRLLIEQIKQMTLFESVEKIILFFGLGLNTGNSAYLNSLQDSILEYSSSFSADIPSFLEWWDTTGSKRSVIVSDQPDSMRVMTIHKSKGLEFKVAIIPFISWSMGHGSSTPTLWVSPVNSPFNNLGIVPVRYKADLQYSDFANDYFDETYYTLVDNLNLLYVAFTRAVDGLIGFCPLNGRSGTISSALYEALIKEVTDDKSENKIRLPDYFNSEKNILQFGSLADRKMTSHSGDTGRIMTKGYYVNHGIRRLHLKFHGENWLQRTSEERKNRINYGKLMHEILESVRTFEDIPGAIEKELLQGRITNAERPEIEKRINDALKRPEVKEWFKPGLTVMNESEILTSDGNAKRPDRVIITDDKVTVIDFKFGKEKAEYRKQVTDYRLLLEEMGYNYVEAFIWYVDNDKIIKVR